jgi:hypothetical protein
MKISPLNSRKIKQKLQLWFEVFLFDFRSITWSKWQVLSASQVLCRFWQIRSVECYSIFAEKMAAFHKGDRKLIMGWKFRIGRGQWHTGFQTTLDTKDVFCSQKIRKRLWSKFDRLQSCPLFWRLQFLIRVNIVNDSNMRNTISIFRMDEKARAIYWDRWCCYRGTQNTHRGGNKYWAVDSEMPNFGGAPSTKSPMSHIRVSDCSGGEKE